MNRFSSLPALVLALALTACGGANTPVAESATTAIAAPQVQVEVESGVVIASAEVLPAQIVRLGFTIPGQLGEIKVQKGDSVKTGDTLVVLSTPDLEYALAAAEAAEQAAVINAELQNADRIRVVNENTGRVSFVTLPYETYQKAKIKAEQAQAVLDGARINLAAATLTSPVDAVVASVDVLHGELVQAGQTVLTLAALDALQVETTDLSERDIARVQAGQPVDVYIEALDLTVTGRVVRISPVSRTVGGDVVFPVTVELDEQPEGLLWGMTAEVKIHTE